MSNDTVDELVKALSPCDTLVAGELRLAAEAFDTLAAMPNHASKAEGLSFAATLLRNRAEHVQKGGR